MSPRGKRRKPSGSSRITLDVGGTTFVTAASTLTHNSSYFASLLSGTWKESTHDVDELFLDQDPVPFGILLAYMRRGLIKVENIDTDVLTLAEFLGIDKLLLAVKVRWYINIGRGPILSDDDDIAAKFDRKHGGISNAISSGLFPFFLKQDDAGSEKEYAILTIFSPNDDFRNRAIIIDEIATAGEKEEAACIIGALNGLHLNGYTVHEKQLDKSNRYEQVMTFSRRKHSIMSSDVTGIFIPNGDEISDRAECRCSTKQFVMMMEDTEVTNETILAPAQFSPRARHDPMAVVQFDGRGPWLERNGFITREEEYEQLFKGYIKSLLAHHFPGSRRETFRQCRIYSRKIQRPEKIE